MNKFKERALTLLTAVFVVYGILVATHKGEFWPFSIYPMFSKAGNPWTRAIVRDVSDTPESLVWETTRLDSMHGNPVALRITGADQIDFSNFISKTRDWNHSRRHALITMFGKSNLGNSKWMVHKVNGYLTAGDSVVVDAIPFLLVTRDTVVTNPNLPDSSYTP